MGNHPTSGRAFSTSAAVNLSEYRNYFECRTQCSYGAELTLSFGCCPKMHSSHPCSSRVPLLSQCFFSLFCSLFRCFKFCFITAAKIDDVEADWKWEFHKWSTQYIVDWKAEFGQYVKQARRLQSYNLLNRDELWNLWRKLKRPARDPQCGYSSLFTLKRSRCFLRPSVQLRWKFVDDPRVIFYFPNYRKVPTKKTHTGLQYRSILEADIFIKSTVSIFADCLYFSNISDIWIYMNDMSVFEIFQVYGVMCCFREDQLYRFCAREVPGAHRCYFLGGYCSIFSISCDANIYDRKEYETYVFSVNLCKSSSAEFWSWLDHDSQCSRVDGGLLVITAPVGTLALTKQNCGGRRSVQTIVGTTNKE